MAESNAWQTKDLPLKARRNAGLITALSAVCMLGAFGAGYVVRAQGESDWVPPRPLPLLQLVSTAEGHRIVSPAQSSPRKNESPQRTAEVGSPAATSAVVTRRSSEKSSTKPYQTLDEVRRAIRDNYVKQGVSDEELTNGAIRGMLRAWATASRVS
jgi:hypothetical protein